MYKLAFKLAVQGHCVFLFSVFFNRERGPQIPATVISPVYEDHTCSGNVEIVPSLSPQSRSLIKRNKSSWKEKEIALAHETFSKIFRIRSRPFLQTYHIWYPSFQHHGVETSSLGVSPNSPLLSSQIGGSVCLLALEMQCCLCTIEYQWPRMQHNHESAVPLFTASLEVSIYCARFPPTYGPHHQVHKSHFFILEKKENLKQDVVWYSWLGLSCSITSNEIRFSEKENGEVYSKWFHEKRKNWNPSENQNHDQETMAPCVSNDRLKKKPIPAAIYPDIMAQKPKLYQLKNGDLKGLFQFFEPK